jgi:polysaccharide deacetylase family protein (PEP-CTERM system associated)
VINALTVDFEDWYHGLTSTSAMPERWPDFERRLEGASTWLLDALDRRGTRATFFIIGVVARQYPDLVRRIAESGHEIGLHSDMHRLVRSMDRAAFRDDLAKNIESVRSAAGRDPSCYRAPAFSISARTPWFWEELAAAGIGADSSVFPIRTPLYGLPGAPRRPFRVATSAGTVLETPITTVRLLGRNLPFSGGFYFRALPYSLVRRLARSENANGRAVCFYFHPWEFDPAHPRPDFITRRERISHYTGLTAARAKFERLLDDFAMAPLGEIEVGMVPTLEPSRFIGEATATSVPVA